MLEACERTVERIAEDPRYFARPARSLFEEIRFYFPITQQARVYFVIDRAISLSTSVRAEQARRTEALNRCRAMTRKGAPCQRSRCPAPRTARRTSTSPSAPRPAPPLPEPARVSVQRQLELRLARELARADAEQPDGRGAVGERLVEQLEGDTRELGRALDGPRACARASRSRSRGSAA